MAKRIAVHPGDKFGRLTFVARLPELGAGRASWQCDCGSLHTAGVSAVVVQRSTASCGCFHDEAARDNNLRHGMRHSPLYSAYHKMRERTRGDYHLVRGGYLGVGRDPRWDTFEGFLAHPPAGEYEPGKVLARYGDKGDYTPENARWATKAENAREAIEPRMLRLPDGRFALDVARANGITRAMFGARVQSGWPLELACTAPKGSRRVNL